MTDGFAYPPETVELPSLAVARRIRDSFPDCIHEEADDGRSTTVELSADTPDYCMARIERIAHRAWDSVPETYGQIPLERHEKRRIDFSETTTFHARSCKGIGRGKGVDDWLAGYDTSLTVDEHRAIYDRQGAQDVDMRRMPAEKMGVRA